MASIFTRIATGELPGHFVWKDELCFSILTIEPICRGHVLVIPYEEVDHWIDVPEDTAAHLFTVSQKISKTLNQVFPCVRVGVMIAGLEVPHTHIHLLPVNSLKDFNFALARPETPEELLKVATMIRQSLLDAGHDEVASL